VNNGGAVRTEAVHPRRALSKGLKALTAECALGRLYVRQWRALTKARTEYATLNKASPLLLKLISFAFASQALAIASRLVDQRAKRGKEPATVYWLLRFAGEHADDCFRHPEAVRAGVREDKQKLKNQAKAISSLRAIRNDYLAHLGLSRIVTESKSSADSRFGPGDAEVLLETIGHILNRYSRCSQNSETYMDRVLGEEKTDWLLGFLARSLEAANTYEEAELRRLLDELYHITKKGLVIRNSGDTIKDYC